MTPSSFDAHFYVDFSLNRNPNCFLSAVVKTKTVLQSDQELQLRIVYANFAINHRKRERRIAFMENMCSFPINYASATGRLRAVLCRIKGARDLLEWNYFHRKMFSGKRKTFTFCKTIKTSNYDFEHFLCEGALDSWFRCAYEKLTFRHHETQNKKTRNSQDDA